MKRARFLLALPTLLVGAALVAGCGDEDSTDPPSAAPQAETQPAAKQPGTKPGEEPAPKRRPTIVTSDSEFGEILVDSSDQAIYIFENDSRGRTSCFGECARAWPPVLTGDGAAAGPGVDESLLGTVKRPSGDVQVTYAGMPLYYYAHEDPGEVLCHNVDLNGGLWWVIGPDGERRP
jgi:predicted lipoprotein with Yx(FWY)xxD motif